MSAPGRPPSLVVERALLSSGAPLVIGCDEVGRGALAGPVGVGVAVLDATRTRIPNGLRDSKLLPEPARVSLEPRVRAWVAASAVGLASNDEIDTLGLSVALGLAGARALLQLADQGVPLDGASVLLDGNWNYLTAGLVALGASVRPTIVTRIKADRDCSSVAAASVIAKVHRDGLMIARHDEHPHYLWRSNKGYASRAHYAAIDLHGPTDWHRRTWLHADRGAYSAADGAPA